MKKIPTLFVRNWDDDPKHVTRQPDPECGWVLAGQGMPTIKWDGTCVMLDNQGQWWARREVKPGKTPPPGFVELATDDETGKVVGWEPVAQSPFARWFDEAAKGYEWTPGTYELIGPRINGNPEDFPAHTLIRHGHAPLADQAVIGSAPRSFDALAEWLHAHPYEGIVWHHPDGRMAKIKRRDFPKPEAAS